MKSTKKKIFVITGAGAGFGRAFAEAALTYCASRRNPTCDALASNSESEGLLFQSPQIPGFGT
jgi:NADP-dependent 3-hydroxy acid dehydrogenase YdfG